MTRALIFLAAIASCEAVRAEDVKWMDLCQHGKDQELRITTKDGRDAHGRCLGQGIDWITIGKQSLDELVFGSEGTIIRRQEIASVRQDHMPRVCTMASATEMSGLMLLLGVGSLGTEYFFLSPVGIAASAVTLVGGVPVCGVFQLVNLLGGSRKLTII